MVDEQSNEANGGQDVFDVDKIRELVKLMEEHDLSEVDLRNNPRRIRLRRGPETAPMMTMPMPAAAAPSQAAPAPSPAAAAADSTSAPVDDANITVVTSPMVGTFYTKPNPDAPTFVKVGDQVEPDTVICLVEAMKMFNEIPAGVSGKVVEILLKNEDPVDVNCPLVKIKTG